MPLPKNNQSLFALVYFIHNFLLLVIFNTLLAFNQFVLHFVNFKSQICVLIFKFIHQIHYMTFSKVDIELLDQAHSLFRCQPRDVLGSLEQMHLVRVVKVNICCNSHLLWYLLSEKKTFLLFRFGFPYHLPLGLQLELKHEPKDKALAVDLLVNLLF